MNVRNNGKSISMLSLCSKDSTISTLKALHLTSSIGFSTDLGSLSQIKGLMTHILVSLHHLQPNWVERWSPTDSGKKKTNIMGCALLKNLNTRSRRQFFVDFGNYDVEDYDVAPHDSVQHLYQLIDDIFYFGKNMQITLILIVSEVNMTSLYCIITPISCFLNIYKLPFS